jgi:hypothetical protein
MNLFNNKITLVSNIIHHQPPATLHLMLYNNSDTSFSLHRGSNIAEVLTLTRKPGVHLMESLIHQQCEYIKNKTPKKKSIPQLLESTTQQTDNSKNPLGNDLSSQSTQRLDRPNSPRGKRQSRKTTNTHPYPPPSYNSPQHSFPFM